MSLSNFQAEVASRDLEMEYRLLTRLNCHKLQYDDLCKIKQHTVQARNRYGEILPYKFNKVNLKKTENSEAIHPEYINASYVNVRFSNSRLISSAAATRPSSRRRRRWTLLLKTFTKCALKTSLRLS